MKKADIDNPYMNGPKPDPLPASSGPRPWSEVMHPQPWAPVLSTGIGAGIGALASGQRGALKGSLYGLTMPSAISGGLWLGSRVGDAVGAPGPLGLAGAIGGGYLTHKLIQHLTSKKNQEFEDDDNQEKLAGYASYIPGPNEKRPLKYVKSEGEQPSGLTAVGFPDDKQIDPKVLTKAQVIAAAKKLYTDQLKGLYVSDGHYTPKLYKHLEGATGLDDKAKERMLANAKSQLPAITMMQSPHYSPATNSVAVFGDNPAILAHELGHAADFNSDRNILRRISRKLPIYGQLRTEYVADRNAKKILSGISSDPDKQKRIDALRRSTLYPSYGTYLGGALGGILGAGAGGVGAVYTGAPLLPLIGSVLGAAGGAYTGGWTGRGLAGLLNDGDWKKKETN